MYLKKYLLLLSFFCIVFSFCKKEDIDDGAVPPIDTLSVDTTQVDTTNIDTSFIDTTEVDTSIIDTTVTLQPPCVDTNPELEDTACYMFPEHHTEFGPLYEYPEVLYNTPVFNPNNKEEIIYKKYIDALPQALVKLHLPSKTETILIDGTIWGTPDWSVKDWILFNKGDNQIWVIKSDGTGEERLTDPVDSWNVMPQWNSTGEQIVFASDRDKDEGKGRSLFFMDFTSRVVTPILNTSYCSAPRWSPDDRYIVYNSIMKGIGEIIDLTTNEQSRFTELEEFRGGGKWHPITNELWWSSTLLGGVVATDLSGANTQKKLRECDSKYYGLVDFSTDGSLLVAIQYRKHVLDVNYFHIYNYIVTIDENGCEQVAYP